jgi:hypothetical protein
MRNHRWLTAMRAHRWLTAGALVATLSLAGAAQADPAKVGEDGPTEAAFRAFGAFARSWMSDMEQRESANRSKPIIQQHSGRQVATYTGYAPEWNVEVHPTGDRSAPYVGVLHYEEQSFTCRDGTTRDCSLAGSTPVTEVFPYRDGTWKY